MFSKKTEVNAAGREVLLEINETPQVPFKGVGKYKPEPEKRIFSAHLTSHLSHSKIFTSHR